MFCFVFITLSNMVLLIKQRLCNGELRIKKKKQQLAHTWYIEAAYSHGGGSMYIWGDTCTSEKTTLSITRPSLIISVSVHQGWPGIIVIIRIIRIPQTSKSLKA